MTDGRSLSVSVSSSMNPEARMIDRQLDTDKEDTSSPVKACVEVTLIQLVDKHVLVAKQAGRTEHVSSSGVANHLQETRLILV